MIQPRKSYLY